MPLIGIADSRSFEQIFFKDTSLAAHFQNNWSFTDLGFSVADSNESWFTNFEELSPSLYQTFYIASEKFQEGLEDIESLP